MNTDKRLRVVICGAGIGGLTAAVALSQYPDIEVEIYEAAAELGEVGAGIGLFPRPWEIIQLLGLEADLLKLSEVKRKEGPVTAFRYRKSDQAEGLDFYTLITNGNLILVHRADFQKVLLRRLSRSCRTHCSKRLRSYTQRPGSGPIEVLFEDGSKTSCDVLIGADGLKSAVRRSLLGEKIKLAQAQRNEKEAAELHASIEAVWSGTNAYRALIPAEKLRARAPDHRVFKHPTQYLGQNGYIIAYPISQGKLINFVAFTARHDLENTHLNGPWVSMCDKNEFTQQFTHWEPEVQTLFDVVEKPLRWAVHTVRPMRSFVSGRVVLVGDAAHAMTPHQGSGAGQAIEDGFMLSLFLGHPSTTRDTLERVLQKYDRVRRVPALQVMERSRMNGRYFTFHPETLSQSGVDVHVQAQQGEQQQLKRKLHDLGEAFSRNWEWAWRTSVQGAIQEARQLLES